MSFGVVNAPCEKYDGDAAVKVLVLHHTAGRESSDLATLLGSAQVSIHIYVTKSGTIYLMVPVGKRAWHCGNSMWGGYSDINSHSVGIELENFGDSKDPFPDAQLQALDVSIMNFVRPAYGLIPITRHRDISREGKIDPADNFPWHLYAGGVQQVADRFTGEEVVIVGSMSGFSGDFDGDGKDELVVFYDYGNSKTGVFFFDPDNNFQPQRKQLLDWEQDKAE